MSLWTMCLPGHLWLCWSYAGAPASHKTVPRTTNWRYINMLCSESFHMASSAAPVTALVKPQNLKLRLCIWQQGSLFLILSYPGLFKNIPHVWFLRLYSLIKNTQHDFPKMRGGVDGRLELFRKFIRFGRGRLPLLWHPFLLIAPYHQVTGTTGSSLISWLMIKNMAWARLFCAAPSDWGMSGDGRPA